MPCPLVSRMKQLGRRAASRLILEIDIGQRLAVVVAHYWSKRLVLNSLGRLTGVSRIEAVFRAHVGDDRKILAASDQTDDG